jgi:uncharacterized membrane protein YdbT with pleckstrin-like domain
MFLINRTWTLNPPSLTVQTIKRSDKACFRKQKGRCIKLMPLIHVVVVLIVVGVLLWLVNRFIPMAGSIKSILNVVVVIVVVLWLLNIFGIYNYHSMVHMWK